MTRKHFVFLGLETKVADIFKGFLLTIFTLILAQNVFSATQNNTDHRKKIKSALKEFLKAEEMYYAEYGTYAFPSDYFYAQVIKIIKPIRPLALQYEPANSPQYFILKGEVRVDECKIISFSAAKKAIFVGKEELDKQCIQATIENNKRLKEHASLQKLSNTSDSVKPFVGFLFALPLFIIFTLHFDGLRKTFLLASIISLIANILSTVLIAFTFQHKITGFWTIPIITFAISCFILWVYMLAEKLTKEDTFKIIFASTIVGWFPVNYYVVIFLMMVKQTSL